MAWVQGQGESAKVTLYTNGQIEWNTAAQVTLRLGVSGSVAVFYDSASSRLGFRRGSDADCVRVLFDEDMKYSLDASEQLGDLGITIAEEVTLDLQPPTPPTPPANLGDEGIYWVTLPE